MYSFSLRKFVVAGNSCILYVLSTHDASYFCKSVPYYIKFIGYMQTDSRGHLETVSLNTQLKLQPKLLNLKYNFYCISYFIRRVGLLL